MEGDWFSEEGYEERIQRESLERRQDPVQTTLRFLQETLVNNTEEEARQMWKYRSANAAVWAEDVLWCLNQVAQSPPDHLELIIREQAQVHLFHDDEPPTRYSDQEVAQWLQHLANEYASLLRQP